MLKWLFGKKIAKAEALERYLSHFAEGELAYLKNITLMGLMPGGGVPGGLSASDKIDLATYIHAEWMVARGQIPATPVARSGARAPYRIRLAKDISHLGRGGMMEFFSMIDQHRLDEPTLDRAQEERLGAHAIMLDRLYRNPMNAPTLPELEEIGEGWASPPATQ